MFARRNTYLIRTYYYSIRRISKELASIKPNEIAKYIASTENTQDTLNLNWRQMDATHKKYFQYALQNNEPITKQKTHIDHITFNDTAELNKTDGLNIIEWINTIISSPNNKIKHLHFDLTNANDTDKETIDSECIDTLCDGIRQNPNNTIELESLQFHGISLSTDNVQSVFDTIKYKCKYCQYLSFYNCNLNGDEIVDIIYKFYYKNDYYGLRNTSLREIDLYGTNFERTLLFHNHALVTLNRNMKKFLRLAIKSYGDYLRVENVLIHTNDRYFMFCIFPNLRMTLGTISKEYASYCRDVVRYNRRNFSEEMIQNMRKMAIVVWFALTLGCLCGDIIKRGKRSWWFRVPELLGLDSVKQKKRDTYQDPSHQKKDETWWKRTFG